MHNQSLKVNWREMPRAKNSFAALYAACGLHGIRLNPVKEPEHDITCYSLNSINWPHYRDEIHDAACITIAGGPHVSACPQEVARYADYCVVGEGEYTLPRLIRCLSEGGGMVPPGVATRDGLRPVDHCVWLNAYPPFDKVKGYIEITRGCPHNCAYCQTPRLFGRRMRHRTIDEIAKYARAYRDVRFISPNALAYGSDGIRPRLDRVERLFKRLRENSIFFGTFPSEVRPEFVTEESLCLIDTYCANRKLHFGAQSGSDSVLKRLSRGHSVADVTAAVELCRDHDIIPVVDVIVGFPFETDDDQQQTLDLVSWIASSGGRIHAHFFTPLPGTPLAGTSPRSLLPETQQLFGRLSLNGKLTGSWIDPQARFFTQDNE